MKLLLDWDPDIDPQDIGLNASLQAAAMLKGNEEIVQYLLNRGADPNYIDYLEITPLMHASTSGSVSIVQILLKCGVDLERKDHSGKTALNRAAGRWGSKEIVQLLLENGADINSEDNSGHSALFSATFQNRYETLLVLLTYTKIKISPDRYGRTLLHVAAIRGHLESVLILLKFDAIDCEAQDKFGRTALSDAIMRNRFDVVKVLETFSETSSQVTVKSVVKASS